MTMACDLILETVYVHVQRHMASTMLQASARRITSIAYLTLYRRKIYLRLMFQHSVPPVANQTTLLCTDNVSHAYIYYFLCLFFFKMQASAGYSPRLPLFSD